MRAFIVDIGSNSIRSMEAEYAEGAFRFFDKRVFTTRLADGLLKTGLLAPKHISASLLVLDTIRAEANARQTPVYAYATSAVRDAKNSDVFRLPAERALGCSIRVLSGAQEAAYAYDGAADGRGGLIDIGGGSTQVMCDGFCKSFPLGCVRARDACGEQNDFEALYAQLIPFLDACFRLPLPHENMRWTAVGGTATTLAALLCGAAAYDSAAIQGFPIEADAMRALLIRLGALSDARADMPLLAARHDVILGGGAILLYLMERLPAPYVFASDRDGMEGFARAMLCPR